MNPSFAHFRLALLGAGLASGIAACASLPPPTSELAAAQQAVARADAADADQYAAEAIAQARAELAQAQAAMARGREDDARALALAATADAEMAAALSDEATARADYARREAEVAELQQRLRVPADLPTRTLPGGPVEPVAPGTEPARLLALEADARYAGLAAYERLRAHQALDALAAARAKQRPAAQALAARRVAVAELAARTQALQREIARLDRTRSDLLVEASRQEAERARQEAEQLRIQAQIQAEEAQRLREAAEAEAAARQQAEDVISDVASDQAARLAAAREKEAALARQEAELAAGAQLPPARVDGRGEVYTLGGDAFASGQASLTPGALASVRALAEYLGHGSNLRVRIEGHTDGQGEADANLALSQRRANAVRDALAAAGIPRARVEAVGRGESDPLADDATAGGRARNRRVEIIVSGQ